MPRPAQIQGRSGSFTELKNHNLLSNASREALKPLMRSMLVVELTQPHRDRFDVPVHTAPQLGRAVSGESF